MGRSPSWNRRVLRTPVTGCCASWQEAKSWALLGGALAVMEFGPLNQWTNNYWGGSLSAAAGCLVFGALPPN